MRPTMLLLSLVAVFACRQESPIETPLPPPPSGAPIPPPPPPSPYVAIDLGTLGGVNTWALALDDSGRVVGNSEKSDGSHRAFIWERGVMRELPGGLCIHFAAMNNRGQVVALDCQVQGPWVWESITAAPRLLENVGYASSDVSFLDINDRGDVLLQGHETTVVLWRNGVATSIEGLRPPYSRKSVGGWNEHSQVVGASMVDEIGTAQEVRHAFLWENGRLEDLTGQWSGAADINNHGVIAGWIDGTTFRLKDSVLVRLDVPWANYPILINERGHILGTDTEDATPRPFVWDSTGARAIPHMGGWTFGVGMNESGEVTGWGQVAWDFYKVFAWSNGVMTDLGGGPGAGDRTARPVAINEAGEILATSSVGCRPPAPACVAGAPFKGILWRKRTAAGQP
jgi:probable HAF family extracellular repeat protein